MAQNPGLDPQIPLNVFAGLVTNIDPAALPAGASPDCSDVAFLPGGVSSRPCMVKNFASPIYPNTTCVYGKSFVDPTGVIRNLYLYSNGGMTVEYPLVTPGVETALLDNNGNAVFVPAGSYMKSVTAFGREYIAPFSGQHGNDIPLQYDGTYLDRVTQDGPGSPPQIISLPLPSVSMALDGAAPTVTIGGIYVDQQVGGFWTAINIYAGGDLSSATPGTSVAVTGTTGSAFVGTYTVTLNPGPGGAVTCSAFFPVGTLNYTPGSPTGTLTIGAGSGTTLARNNNVVTALTAKAHNLQIGYLAQIAGVAAATVGTSISSITINNEDNPGIATVTTSSAHGLVPGASVSLTGIVGATIGTSVSSMIRAGQVVTVHMSGPTGLTPGSIVAIKNVSTTSFNVGATPVINVTTTSNPGDTFTYGQSDVDATATVGSGTVTLNWPIPETPVPTYFDIQAAPTTTTFQVAVNYADGSWSGGSVTYAWDGKFYVTSVLTPTTAIKTTLSSAITTTTATSISVTSGAGIANGETLQIDSEQMTVTSGGGTTTIVVVRGVNGTAAVTHMNGSSVLLVTFGVTYRQYGPNATTTSVGTVTPFGQATPGEHLMQVLFLTRQGYTTTPSPPVKFVANGGQYLSVSNLPIGPSNIVARIVAFTGAQGAYYFYIPAPPQVNGLIVGTSTQVNDNVSTSAIFDFGDPTLFAALGISIPGNNLANQVVIDSALGFGYYGSRLFTYGQRNIVDNLLNIGFDGGYLPTAATTPTGWTSAAGNVINKTTLSAAITTTTATSISLTSGTGIANGAILLIDSEAVLVSSGGGTTTLTVVRAQNGTFAATHISGAIVYLCPAYLAAGHYGSGWLIAVTAGAGAHGALSQSMYEDYTGAPIATANTQYKIRLWLKPSVAAADLVFTVSMTSATTGFSSTATIGGNTMSTSGSWLKAAFSALTPSVIPSDFTLSIYATTSATTLTLLIDELNIIYSATPYLNGMFASYVNNPEAFDGVTGVIGPVNDTHQVFSLGIVRNNLYMLTQDPAGRLHETSQGITEPADWLVEEVASNCGTVSPLAVTQSQADDSSAAGGEEWFAWFSATGIRIFGGERPEKISQEIQRPLGQFFPGAPQDLGALNTAAQLTVWALNDPEQKQMYFGIPSGVATAPNIIYVLSYLGLDSSAEIAGNPPVHKALGGKVAASDLGRKWSPWQLPMNGAGLMYRSAGSLQPVFFGGNGTYPGVGGTPNSYILNPTYHFTDDTYGQVFPYYVTYGFPDRDTEQALQLGGGLKMNTYFQALFAGIGYMNITILYNTLANVWPLPGVYLMNTNPLRNAEWGAAQATAQRFFYKFSSSPNPSGSTAYPATDNAFNLSVVVVGMKKNTRMQVAGTYP